MNVKAILDEFFNVLGSVAKIDLAKTEIKNSFGFIILLSHIFIFSNIILKIFPHESIGRYPQKIGGESSLQIYRERSHNICNLTKEVKIVCEHLDIVLDDETLHEISDKLQGNTKNK